MPALQDLLPAVIEIARGASQLVMSVYEREGSVAHTRKADTSPVTEADELAEQHIVTALQALWPGIPVVAEESVTAGRVPEVQAKTGRFWLVDPLDGTREFIARNGEFTVNIALVEAGQPVLGVVVAPAIPGGGMIYFGSAGQGAWVARGDEPATPIHTRAEPPQGLTLVGSRSHGDDAALERFIAEHLAGRKVAETRAAGSSLKLCLLAAGQADLYPRLGRTMEWDIAAGHAVLAAAGGQVLTLSGQPLRYGKSGFENPHFVAQAAPA
jgi:3'(2'), 5'-bisphosphate nucleotidase